MSIKPKELTFEGGVNIDKDPHLIKSNEWQSLQNLWPYKSKLLGSRPSLLFEQDVLPVDAKYWNSRLFHNSYAETPVSVPYYYNWFRYLTPLKSIFLGELSKIALICVCNNTPGVTIREQFEGEAAVEVQLIAGDVVLLMMPNDLQPGAVVGDKPILSGVRLGKTSNLTPSMVEINGEIIAVNVGCDYVVRVAKSSSLAIPSATTWSNIDYRFTKLNFGDTNTNFKPNGVVTYKNRFVYFKGNKLWFSDPFQPEVIYDDVVATAYLAVFFDTNLTEDITALAEIYTSSLDEAGTSVLAIWTAHSMLMMKGEPATTIASTPEELFAPVNVTKLPITAGCISQASVVKTKHGIIWCGASTVWFMARGNLPVEVGQKIGPRIQDQSLDSAGRIFATYDDEVYKLVINTAGVGYNPFDALNEMWCLSFIGDLPTKENAAWFGPQVFTNRDNPVVGTSAAGGPSGLYCCAKLTNNNDDKTWYIQPYSCATGDTTVGADTYATRLGLSSISQYYGVDITAPYRPANVFVEDNYYYPGDIFHLSRGKNGEEYPYNIEYVVMNEGTLAGTLIMAAVYANDVEDLPPGPSPTYTSVPLYAKRPLMAYLEASIDSLMPKTHKIGIQSGLMTFDAPELVKVMSGYELTFKTLNPVLLNTHWWPWEPKHTSENVVMLASRVNLPTESQNVLDAMFNEPVLTARRIMPPKNKRYNGLSAQLNIEEPEYKVVHGCRDVAAANPNWGKLRISTDNVMWYEPQLFTFDGNGISKHATLFELMGQLIAKVSASIGLTLDVDPYNVAGCGLKFATEEDLYIDLSAQGWEWFGFVPTNLDLGYGVNIITNKTDHKLYLRATGPVPVCTPHAIHLAKLNVRYSVLGARPR